MLYRKITKDIQEWYQNSSTGLLVDGARQIGKTTSIRDFLVTNNISFIFLHFSNLSNENYPLIKIEQRIYLVEKHPKKGPFPSKSLVYNPLCFQSRNQGLQRLSFLPLSLSKILQK